MSGNNVLKHILLPLIPSAALLGLYFTPKSVFGCANRGIMALGIAFLATAASVATTSKGFREKKGGNTEDANWWILTTVILLFPIVLLFGPLG